MKTTRILALLSVVVSLFSCDTQVLYEKNYALEDKIWQAHDIKAFEVEIKDTLQLYDLFLNLRNSKSYRFANLYLFAKTTYPSGRITKDTLQFFLADPKGKWLGTSAGDLVNHQIMFSHNTVFPETGNYLIEFEQGMRDENLEHIADVGLRVARTK